MKVKVAEGYIGFERKVYGIGTVLELSDKDAAYLLREGVVVKVDEKVVADVSDEQADTSAGEDEMTLPDIDPAAAVKSGKKK